MTESETRNTKFEKSINFFSNLGQNQFQKTQSNNNESIVTQTDGICIIASNDYETTTSFDSDCDTIKLCIHSFLFEVLCDRACRAECSDDCTFIIQIVL